jgi:L-aspartate oxidase
MKREVDFLVIGSGVAGLSFALKVAQEGKVCLISKNKMTDTNTQLAQGGIAAVTYSPDSYKKHIEDTMVAGGYLNDRKVVEMVVSQGATQIQQLINWGTNFDKTNDGLYDLAREGGHSEHRILHYKDKTGYEIQRALSEKVLSHPNIEVLEHHFAIEIITQHHLGQEVFRRNNNIQCYGAYVLNMENHKIHTFLARTTFIATGGIGNIYQTTTNPEISTGDGIAMVYRAKGTVADMEFIQFHPTALYNPKERPAFLITEALRGAGAILRNRKGEEFMSKYDPRASLAPRDVVSRAIDSEMKVSGDDHVFLDATHVPTEELKNHFPNIYAKCLSLGIDIGKDYIPVVPAVHYVCGGIKVDAHARTSIIHLYAAGESSATGLHGANRLASNSLIEAVVYADNAAKHALSIFKNIQLNRQIPDWNDEGTLHPEEMILITQEFKELRAIMSNYVGIVRSEIRLKRALDRLNILYTETEELFKRSTVSREICELRNAINVAYLIIKMAQNRKESIGLHYIVNYQSFL